MGSGADFEHTSALRVSVILLAFVVLSVVFEKLLHWLVHWFDHIGKDELNEVLERLKDEIMLVGFLSLLLLAVEDKLLTICMDPATFNSGIPVNEASCGGGKQRRRLAGSGDGACSDGEEPFVSASALHQTHILIFLMAALHISYCAATMFITQWTASKWYKHEEMIINKEVSKQIMAKLQKHVPVVHDKPWKEALSHFFGQFTGSVNGLTYVSLRNWFIAKHRLPYKYSFHEYIMRCIHKDFEATMGVRWWMWLLLIVNVISDGFNVGNIFIPTSTVVLALAVGAKLHSISTLLTRKCFELHDYNDNATLDEDELYAMHTVSDGRMTTLAEIYINDKLFWFEKPNLLLACIQCVMFQNALELATAAFYAWQVGTSACFFDATGIYVFIRMGVSGFLLFHNAYVMLPCYSLVVQMGSRFNKAIVTDEVRKRLRMMRRAKAHQHGEHGADGSVITRLTSQAKRTTNIAVSGLKSVADRVERSAAGAAIKHVKRRMSNAMGSSKPSLTAEGEGYDRKVRPQSLRDMDAKSHRSLPGADSAWNTPAASPAPNHAGNDEDEAPLTLRGYSQNSVQSDAHEQEVQAAMAQLAAARAQLEMLRQGGSGVPKGNGGASASGGALGGATPTGGRYLALQPLRSTPVNKHHQWVHAQSLYTPPAAAIEDDVAGYAHAAFATQSDMDIVNALGVVDGDNAQQADYDAVGDGSGFDAQEDGDETPSYDDGGQGYVVDGGQGYVVDGGQGYVVDGGQGYTVDRQSAAWGPNPGDVEDCSGTPLQQQNHAV